jgi:gp16 family phage-associated protein
MALTPAQVKQRLRNEGKTLKQFAAEHNFPEMQVYRVMNGTIKGAFGRGHEIAVALGLKNPTEPPAR